MPAFAHMPAGLLAGYSVVQGPRTSMVRPHPAVWRFVHGVSVVYVLGLVWLLFQTVEDARAGLKVGLSGCAYQQGPACCTCNCAVNYAVLMKSA